MKKLYFLLLAFSLFTTANSQIVTIPDANFKLVLLEANTSNYKAQNLSGAYFKIDANSDGEIQEIEALNVSSLDVSHYISTSIYIILNLNGIQSFKNLQTLSCDNNDLTSLDVTSLTKLQKLACRSNNLTSLDVTSLTKLQTLDCGYNQLTSLNLTGLTYLKSVYCYGNILTSLNLSGLTNLKTLDCSRNRLTSLNLTNLTNLEFLNCEENQITTLDLSVLNKLVNGAGLSRNKLQTLFINNVINTQYINFSQNPTLKYICVDEEGLSYIQKVVTQYGYTNCVVNSYCSFTPGGIYYTIQGNLKIDPNANGCDELDMVLPNSKINISNGTKAGIFISDTSGNYSIPVQAGTHTISPELENPSYFKISPTTATVTFPIQTSPFIQDFCITPYGVHPDLEVTLLPLQQARPGFDAKYKLVYKNKGTTTQSGSVNLTFNDAALDLVVTNPVTATQTSNNLFWNFTNLLPFETREITFTLNVNSPLETPAVNSGSVLVYNATITSSATDETPIDNTFAFNQTVVNSFDPNDKSCLEGTTITPSLIGQYVHYMIRFENTGTFAAQNIVVKDMIDLTKFDISTLIPTSASHSFVTKISDNNKVEFIFENINLPFDDANNDGYIAFKIKTVPTLVVNDSFTNEANIYFDYNFPILTNKATSTFKTLDTPDFDFGKYFTLYPNPAKAELNITAKETINVNSMSVYNTLGQLVLVIPNAEKVSKIDVSSLTTGNYFIKINCDKGTSNARFIKE